MWQKAIEKVDARLPPNLDSSIENTLAGPQRYNISLLLFFFSLERTTRTRENPGNSSHELGRSLAIVLSVDQLTYMYHSIPTRCSFILFFIQNLLLLFI